VNTNKASNSLQVILKNRQKNFGTFCRIAGRSSDLSLACQTQPMIDTQLMSARAIINTPCEDREGDIIVPKGVHLENFSKNPVVLWEHGLGEITRPIAKCQHPDGKLALEVEEDQILATSYFTDKTLESSQIFHLIAEGLVRATSVRAVPIKSSTRKTSKDGIGIVLEEWELIEWSWGALGVNPDAIARTIHRGTIEGRNISNPLLKSLKSVLSPKNQTIPGWTKSKKKLSQENREEESVGRVHETSETSIQSDNKKYDTNEFVKTEKKRDVSRADSSLGEDRSKAKVKSTPVPEFTNRKIECVPLGAQILKSIQSSITELTRYVNSASVALENERIKSYLNKFLLSLENERIALEKLYMGNYSHLNIPIESEERNLHENDSFTRSSKDWLESDMIRQLKDSDYYGRLKVLSQSANLTLLQRQLLTEILKQISPTRHRQLSYDEKTLERNVEELSQAVVELKQKLSDLLPA